MGYVDFFQTATGKKPFDYQERLAEGDWPHLLDIPTGLGKTAAVVLAWLWRRVQDPANTPRRLVFCLPMRVLVTQTCEAVTTWINRLGGERPAVHLLMGGERQKRGEEWDRDPERAAILIGTQDFLISRALNRGFAQSRYRWPLNFALLNNDCLWIFDETQLLGVALETSAQLQGLRARLGVLKPVQTVWMSATLADDRVATVDHPAPPTGWRKHVLSDEDHRRSDVRNRIEADKPLALADFVLSRLNAKGDYARRIAALVAERHRPGTLTLVVLNQVQRAQETVLHLRKLAPGASVTLLHGRFRPHERAPRESALREIHDGIVVSTQVVEAGVDVSSRLLVTELAPWPSMVQRFGRCNRYGEQGDAEVVWIDSDADVDAAPYVADDLALSRAVLTGLREVGLRTVRNQRVPVRAVVRPVIRKKDVIDLFDTTPDLSGSDVDVSMYVRDGKDVDVYVYWRPFPGDAPDAALPAPSRDELCPVSVGNFRDFVGKVDAWIWNPLIARYEPADRVRPGMIFLLHARAGGYDADLGWVGTRGRAVVSEVPRAETDSSQAYDDDRDACLTRWVPLQEHLEDVARESSALAERLALPDELGRALHLSGRWHDVGKAHCAFQNPLENPDGVWAKSNRPTDRLVYRDDSQTQRRGFRHELASALAWLQHHGDDAQADLIAYLVAAHHGKVRLSIRSLPTEVVPPDPERLFARGVWDGDTLPAISGLLAEPTLLNLSVMRVGEGSWLERMARLRDTLGPFRLGYLEALVRIADWRASEMEALRA